ncbi:MAG: type II toxin-antitoxin system RelE/ParE family toxin [Deltaproteobacteria bacterium]|jgi:mRNA-degrading endonuclease RelE of RelBE toxin-antitoxin system|nr:type II toxin-antitoxin system RelE/ParE family toxin [Deltaproteobacteria bacterium]MBT4526022.1 type II toxin-antitoxin system RelE/ParE family toxin [Deltaproteobacteria bacterium]
MKAIFVESVIFEKLRESYLSDDEFRDLQLILLANPKSGAIIQGTGGLRKIRFGAKGKGKRSGIRVIYYFFDKKDRFYFLTLYSKNEVTDLTVPQKKKLKQFMEVWRNE